MTCASMTGWRLTDALRAGFCSAASPLPSSSTSCALSAERFVFLTTGNALEGGRDWAGAAERSMASVVGAGVLSGSAFVLSALALDRCGLICCPLLGLTAASGACCTILGRCVSFASAGVWVLLALCRLEEKLCLLTEPSGSLAAPAGSEATWLSNCCQHGCWLGVGVMLAATTHRLQGI